MNNKPLLASTISVVGTVIIAIVILSSVGDTSDMFINAIFGLDLFTLGVFATLAAQQIATSDYIFTFLRGMNQPTPEVGGNRVNAFEQTQGRYPWES